jgi:hypothetical protein
MRCFMEPRSSEVSTPRRKYVLLYPPPRLPASTSQNAESSMLFSIPKDQFRLGIPMLSFGNSRPFMKFV